MIGERRRRTSALVRESERPHPHLRERPAGRSSAMNWPVWLAESSGASLPPMIRLCSAEDAPAVAAIYRPIVEQTAISFETDPPSAAEMERRIGAILAFAPYLVFDDGGVAGYAYASRHRERAAYQWSVDVSVYVDQRRRRQGIGRALYGALFALLRLQGFHAAHAGVTLPNPGSVGLHESLGFRPIGVYRKVGYKLGAWHDVGWWQLELRERRGAPEPLRAFSEVRADPRFEAVLRESR